MTHYTVPDYCNPFRQKGYMHYQSKADKRCNCIVAALVAFGAGVAVCTLIQVYFGG